MNSLAFDTHRMVKRLTEAGFSPAQAETVTDALLETRTSDLADLAGKADLQSVKLELQSVKKELQADLQAVRAEIRTLEASLTAKMADGQRATLQWVVGLFVAQTALFAGIVKLMMAH